MQEKQRQQKSVATDKSLPDKQQHHPRGQSHTKHSSVRVMKDSFHRTELSCYATKFQCRKHPTLPFFLFPHLRISDSLSNSQPINHPLQRKHREPNSWKGADDRKALHFKVKVRAGLSGYGRINATVLQLQRKKSVYE